ncbi:type I restriction endonuclease subunit R [Henriciella sp.]|uniref:type I restriction endonuclease subunit R n=1 Tax=Henriciella sp. TaxID=1968823 RepID=UPI00261939F3|nr:type I restriction endonuclease subunit R [Henriciella sp.]
MTRPNTAEIYSAQIPALRVLTAMGWEYLSPGDCLAMRDGNNAVILKEILIDVLRTRTFEYKGETYPLSTNAIDQIVRDLSAPQMQEGLQTASEAIYNKLLFGVTVTEFVNGKSHSPTIAIVDWDNPEKNTFTVTEEFEVLRTDGTSTRRPDIVCFVNGLPLAVIEAKRPDSGNPNKSMIDEGISQTIRNQKNEEIPHLFAYSQLLMSISGTDGRYATTKTAKKFWARWREEELTDDHFSNLKNRSQPANTQNLLKDRNRGVREQMTTYFAGPQAITDQDRLLVSLLSHERLLEFVRFFTFFDRKAGKIAARYQQVFGIKALIEQISKFRPDGSREGGVIWHTTGSGKSFTMVLLCKALLLHRNLSNARIVVVTDRVDLEKQLSRTFASGGAIGRKAKADEATASSGRELANRIGKGQERILFSTIQRFASAVRSHECFNDSPDLIVLVDEGHRSQGGESHERMRKALPNASFIAFTGTPLLKDDKTENKFGPIVHAYTMQRAVEDGTVTPLLYEERRPVLDINETAIDKWFERITAALTDDQRADLKKKYGKKGQVYGSLNRIELIAWDIATHFQDNFKSLGRDLKGQLAADGRLAAIRYKRALDATGLVTSAVVISPPDTRQDHEAVDEYELPELQQWWNDTVKGDEDEYERQILEDFSEPGDPDILIVSDKLLTGFDEPRNSVLYIDKPLKQHNLIQAIARVNRLHEHKRYGLLIDYRGILKELDTALTDYRDLAERTQGGFEIEDIEGLYSDISTEYKRLPKLHDELLGIFSSVKNSADREQYRQVLIPHFEPDESGEMVDVRQKVREDFYEALTAFGMCLKVALGSRSFFDDASVTERQVQTYKQDLKFFSEIRRTAKEDAQETVDFSAYEGQIRRLVDKHVVGEDIAESDGAYLVNELGANFNPEDWNEEKVRNETDIIRSRLKKTIEQDLAVDPYAQAHFSELLRQALGEAEALFDHPYKQYALFKEVEDDLENRTSLDIPSTIASNPHASAYFGILKQAQSNGAMPTDMVELSLKIDHHVMSAVAEHSLNPQNIEAAIRKSVLPELFKQIGLEAAKSVLEKVIAVTRLGLARGTL